MNAALVSPAAIDFTSLAKPKRDVILHRTLQYDLMCYSYGWIRGSNSGRCMYLSSPKRPDLFWGPTQPHYSVGTGVLFPGLKPSWRDVTHSRPLSATPPIRLNGLDRENHYFISVVFLVGGR
jgi:hypothetical protein